MATTLDPTLETPEERELVFPPSGEVEPLVLARRNHFVVTTRTGDIKPAGARDLGFYNLDTRYLSYLELLVAGDTPIGLSSETSNAALSQIDLTLTDRMLGNMDDPTHFLHIRRKQLLDGELLDELLVTNHFRDRVTLTLELRFGVDFADMFEARGHRRLVRGRLLPAERGPSQIVFGYLGRDRETYRSTLRFLPTPMDLTNERAVFKLELEPGEARPCELVVTPLRGAQPLPSRRHFDLRLGALSEERTCFRGQATQVETDHAILGEALERSLGDLCALQLDVNGRSVVSAGIPWFAAPFGRDSLITSLETLAFVPQLAYDALRILSAYQGRISDADREEEPGKILHELRRGEMARSKEIPHSPYFGSVDATPLFCILVGELYRWTADQAFLDEIFPAAERALEWVERALGDGRGLLRYERRTARGLYNQGWKDSQDGVPFPEGGRAELPIALIEAQGYVAAAFDEMATLYEHRGRRDRAGDLRIAALAMRARIEERFTVPETSYYALAIDGRDRVVPTLTSNPGHLLWARAVPESRVAQVADVLLGDAMYSGWGIRTLARGQAVYNPLSYHNGSVWPHDNALAALGFARYGLRVEPLRIFSGLFAASQHFRYFRLPELFCGMGRSIGEFLVKYPVSCSPQAWASGSLFMILQAVLGLEADAPARRLRIVRPRLPESVRRLELHRLRVGNSRVTLRFLREGHRCHVDLLEVEGDGLRVQIELE